MRKRAIRLGLTGGIGSGKSTIAALLNNAGAIVIDADVIARAATASGGAAIAPIRATFGEHVLDQTGALDRKVLRKQVFSDPAAKLRLEAIIHPIVRAEVARQAFVAEESDAQCIVFDIPLLVESGHWRSMFHRIMVVDCSQDTQISRVVERSGLNPGEILRIIAGQASRAERLSVADAVVFNEGITIGELQRHINEIAPQFGL